jgi:hypothetical protein
MVQKAKCWHTDSYFIEEQEIYYCPSCGEWSTNDLTLDDDWYEGDMGWYGID